MLARPFPFILDLFQQHEFVVQFVVSLAFVILWWILRSILIRRLTVWDLSHSEMRGHWLANVRNTSVVFLALGLLLIWGTSLRGIALTIGALSVAIAIAFKEYIMCAMGALYRAMTGSFRVGDRIEIVGLRGDVIDYNVFSTSLLEVGPGYSSERRTGRVVHVLNSFFVMHSFVNESHGSQYGLHTFTFPMQKGEDWRLARELLRESAQRICGPFTQVTQAYFQKFARAKGFSVPNAAPSITLQVHEINRIDLVVRVPVPVQQKAKLEQAILEDFLERFEAATQPKSSRPERIEAH